MSNICHPPPTDAAATAATDTTTNIRRFYEAVRALDAEAAQATLDPDVVLHVPGTHPLAGDHVGLDGIVQFVVDSRAATVDGEDVEVVDVLCGAEYAAALCRVRGERHDGARLDNHTVHLVRTGTDGRIAEVWLHNRDQDHVDAFWGAS